MSQQLVDRGGEDGLAFDMIVLEQAQQDLDAAVDAYVLTQVLANAGSTTDTKTSTATFVTDFYSDVMKAAAAASATGVNLPPTSIFATNANLDFLLAQVDSTGRPLYTPSSAALVAAANDPDWLGWMGFHIGRLSVFSDDNIPAVSSNTQVIVSRPKDVLVWESAQPITQVYIDQSAANLEVWLGFRKYVAAVVRHNAAHQTISGARYPSAPTFVES